MAGNYIGRKAGTKNKTFRGVPVEEYRRARKVMSKDQFEQWVLKVTGKPVMRNNVLGTRKSDTVSYDYKLLSEKLERALRKEQQDHSKTNLKYKECREMLAKVSDELHRERNRSWISRLFNSKG